MSLPQVETHNIRVERINQIESQRRKGNKTNLMFLYEICFNIDESDVSSKNICRKRVYYTEFVTYRVR